MILLSWYTLMASASLGMLAPSATYFTPAFASACAQERRLPSAQRKKKCLSFRVPVQKTVSLPQQLAEPSIPQHTDHS